MTDRVHEYLDGALPRTELTDREERELQALETAIEGSVAFARGAQIPDVAPAVMDRIAREFPETASPGSRRAWLGRALDWIWTPRTVRLRPAWGMAAVAFLALGIATTWNDVGAPAAGSGPGSGLATATANATPGAPVSVTADEPTPVLYVRFELDAAGASSVRLAGTFTDWKPRYDLVEATPGHWTAFVALPPGVHDYAFVVNGERWTPDPDAPRVDDGFGGSNSRIALVAPREGTDGGSS